MTDCLFCKFAKKEIPKEFVLETETLMVFPDIAPVAPVHFLIVPKKHISEFTELFSRHCEESKTTKQSLKAETRLLRFARNDVWNEMMTMVVKLIKQYELDTQGYRLVINGGGAQAIDHLHLHLVGKINKERKL